MSRMAAALPVCALPARFCFALFSLLLFAPATFAQPPVTPGFPNVTQVPGTLLSGLNAPQQGRTAILAYNNGILFTVPELPSSEPNSDFQVRTWNISNPAAPVELAQLGISPMPISAHGYFHSGEYLVLGSNWPPEAPWSFRASGSQGNTRTTYPDLHCAGHRGCLFGTWHIAPTYWSYGAVEGLAELSKDWSPLAEWDHLAETGVIGHPFIVGDLLIFASDQSRTGVATYDISDPTNPVLLDVLNTGGPGGYWPELWGGDGKLYIVFPYQTGGNGFRVVDATDPADLRFLTDRPLPGDESMYVQFQDEFAFMGSHKVDLRTFESVLQLNGSGLNVNTSQFLLPLGNLVVTGGIGEHQGMAIWAHQAAPDTRGPSVGFHIPQAGRTNYPVSLPISLLIHETLETKTIVNGTTFIVRPLGGSAIAGELTFSFNDILTFIPNAPLMPNTTYEVVLPAGGIKDAAGNGMVGYSFTFSTGGTVGGNNPPALTAFAASLYPVPPGQSVTLSAAATDPNGGQLEYRFDFGDGSAKTAWSTTPSTSHVYPERGHYRATVQARDPLGAIASRSTTLTVLEAPTGTPPTHSSPIVLDAAARRVWNVNPDADSVSAVHADSLSLLFEVPVCDEPKGLTRVASGQIWVACHKGDRVRVLDASGTLVADIPTGYGSGPVAITTNPSGTLAFVALGGGSRLLRIDTTTRQITGDLSLPAAPRALAVSPNGSRLFATRFLSPKDWGELYEVATSAFTLTRTLRIPKFGGDDNRDGTASGRGVANYLAAIALSRDGSRAYVAGNKPNTERGPLTAPLDLDSDNSVRSVLVELNLNSNTFTRAIDLDNSDSPSALSLSPLGDYLFVSLQGNDAVEVLDTLLMDTASGLGSFVTRLGSGAAPRGLVVDENTGRTLVHDFMGRGITALETDPLFRNGEVTVASATVTTVGTEPLPLAVAHGKRLFYHASDRRMSAEGYLSCGTCHVDGGHDGRTFDFTGRGEGLRNTTDLRGRGGTGHGNVHWTANFDEIQDFENDIRGAFGGLGFLDDADFAATSAPLGPAKAGLNADLDALAAYLSSLGDAELPKSPFRQADGQLTPQAISGRTLFRNQGCTDCHGGSPFTDSTGGAGTLHDVGTLRTTSGGRLGGPLTGIDSPTLRGVFATAPYLHDGSAESLDAVFTIAGGVVIPAESGSVSGGAQIVNTWVELNNDDTVRGRAYVGFGNPSAQLTFTGVGSGPGGTGALEVRFSNARAIHLRATVNGLPYNLTLPNAGNDPTWRHTNWRTARFENVAWNAGATNTVVFSTTDAFPNISLDEIVVSTTSEFTKAQPHRRVASLSQSDRDALLAYLRQLDGSPEDNPVGALFQDGFESGNTSAWH